MARALRQVDDGLRPTEGPRTTGSRTRVFLLHDQTKSRSSAARRPELPPIPFCSTLPTPSRSSTEKSGVLNLHRVLSVCLLFDAMLLAS